MFPEIVKVASGNPVTARAVRTGALDLNILDIKDFAPGSFRRIDDSPYGGGKGMILRCQPVVDALEAARKESGGSLAAAFTPSGKTYTQSDARRFAKQEHLILICGHYEGMDERIYGYVDERISIGDYILTGGEYASLVVLDSVARLLPGVLKDGCTQDESFENGLLEYPQYTRPMEFRGEKVPEVLLSGDHEAIRRFRRKESLRLTLTRRPDLVLKKGLTEEEEEILGLRVR